MAGIVMLAAQPGSGTERAFTELEGRLPDQTFYLIRMPADWNGTVISDLDFRTRAEHGVYQYLLQHGFALSGTSRRDDRMINLSQRGDVERVQQVLAIFREKFGQPKRVIAYGRSAGGGAALAMAENYPQTTDGAIALCATTPFLSANHRFDFLFLLKGALAPDDASVIVHPLPEDRREVVARWKQVIEAARQTPQGRARIVFAFTAAQFPGFGHTGVETGTPPPANAKDSAQVIEAMLASVVPQLQGTIDNLYQLNTNPAPMVWNAGADYQAYFRNGDPQLKRIVKQLYSEAGLDFDQELARIDALPRVAMDGAGAAVWLDDPVQMPRGKLRVPLFHMHTDGDQSIAQEQSRVYFDNVRRNAAEDLLRTATVHRGGHCTFTTAEEVAAVAVMTRRLDTGKFGDTGPTALNALAASLGTGTESSFIARRLPPFNGEWRLRAWEMQP